MTPAQKRALQTLWPMYGVDYRAVQLDLDEIFGRAASRIMEIGFGNGELLASMAADSPETDFIGVEVHEPGVGHCLLAIQNRNLTNVRVICHDAIEVLKHQIPDRSLQAVHLFFPDPWPKKRHHKRRIVQPAFIELLHQKINLGGLLHTATDWDEYAEHMEATILANKGFRLAGTTAGARPQTRFEQRGRRLGHEITERIFQRI
ncbi:MAG: tRNA (guanosine(46)-N7)-methyltransferase TrmB [Gammaproteobacteria bacterium]|nr:tRNA (guanosine(46)-N7)-methyltransferase TrmB [Gammaproteobacteria bacterium]